MLRADSAQRLVYEDISVVALAAGGVVLLMVIGGVMDWQQRSGFVVAVLLGLGVALATLRRRIEYDRVTGLVRVYTVLSLSPRWGCIEVFAGERCLYADLDGIVVKRFVGRRHDPKFVILLGHKAFDTLPGLFPRRDVLLKMAGTHAEALERARGFAEDLKLPVRDLAALGIEYN